MRWIVYTLLGLNLAYLTYNLQVHGTATRRPDAVPEAPVTESGTVNRLPLLSELGEGSLRHRGEPGFAAARAEHDAAADRDDAAPPDAGRPAEAAASAAIGQGGGAQGGTAAAESPRESSAGAQGSESGESGAAPAPEPSSPLASVGGSGAGAAGGGAAAPDAATEAREPPPKLTCLTLGPLDAEAPVEAIRAWLAERGAAIDVRTDERREVALYWIYFPPRPSRAAATAEVERMRAEGIDDIIVVPKGDMENAISLGVFSRESSRDRRLRQLDQLGYQPSISPRYRTTVATWIEAAVDDDAVEAEQLLEAWPGLEIEAKPCPGPEIAGARSDSYNSGEPPRGPRRFHFSDQRGIEPYGVEATGR